MSDPQTRQIWLLQLLTIGLGILFISKPVHIDEANFLMLAQGPALAPHSIPINWQGTTQSAFDVLSNPPGIAWWLGPIAEAPVFWLRLWMIPWSCLAVLGVWWLSAQYVPNRRGLLCLMVIFSPVFFLANGALMPDMPLMACVLTGMALMTSSDSNSKGGAMLVGMGVLFRYSAISLWPVVFFLGLTSGGWRKGLKLTICAMLPLFLLLLFDLSTYSKWHFGSMLGFQTEGGGPWQSMVKASAVMATLAGAVVPPFLHWTRKTVGVAFVCVGLSWLVVGHLNIEGLPLFWTCLLIGLGCAQVAFVGFYGSASTRVLVLWVFCGIAMMVLLRFVATRYWAPFFVPILILGLRHASLKFCRIGLCWSVFLAPALALDDFEMAKAQHAIALKVDNEAKEAGVFSGHWGWQWRLEKLGWVPIEEDQALTTGSYYARSLNSWPQDGLFQCLEHKGTWAVQDRWPGPRVHTKGGHGNFHSYLIADGLTWSLAPWSFGSEAHDVASLFIVCIDPHFGLQSP